MADPGNGWRDHRRQSAAGKATARKHSARRHGRRTGGGEHLVQPFGLGVATPGYTAGPTLLVSREEQGGLAGLAAATSGLSFVIAPTAGTALYGWWAPLPIIIATGIMALVTGFVLVHPRFRSTAPLRPRPGRAENTQPL